MAGYFLMRRGWMDDPEFCKEAYSRAQAWCWLVEHAAFKPMIVTINGRNISLERGQLAVSERSLAKLWRWSKSRVVRSLTLFKKAQKIGTLSGPDTTVITICNYDRFQSLSENESHQPDHQITEEGGTPDHSKKERELRESIPPLTPPSQGGDFKKVRRVRRAPPQPAEPVDPGVAQWRARLRGWVKSGFWPATAGPLPDDPRCYAPQNLIAEALEQRRAQAPPRDQPQMPLPISGGLAA